MSAPDRIWAWAETYRGIPQGAGGWISVKSSGRTEYLRSDGPIIKAWRAALELHNLDPDSIAREAEKEAQNG